MPAAPFILSRDRSPQKAWRRLSLVFLALLPGLALFHLGMYFAYTRTLFGPEVGNVKRMGYLVGLEDRQADIVAREPKTGFSVVDLANPHVTTCPRVLYLGDSFGGEMLKAFSLAWHEPIGALTTSWHSDNGLSQIMTWVRTGWLRDHGVKVVIVERAEYSWLISFADPGDPSHDVPLDQVRADYGLPPPYGKAIPWNFSNNGNFKVLIDNAAYLFSPTAFGLTETCKVPLSRDFFNCSYSHLLLFYSRDLPSSITDKPKNLALFPRALVNLKALSDLCHQQGLQFYLMIPPNKSTIYYPWVIKPFYQKSRALDLLQQQATPYGYVDLQGPLHQQLENGVKDLYFPDDSHWTYAAAQVAAQAFTAAGAGPK